MTFTITNIRKETIPTTKHHAKTHLHYDVKQKDGSVTHVIRLLVQRWHPGCNTKRFLTINDKSIKVLTSIAQHSEGVDRKTIAKSTQLFRSLVSKKVVTPAKPAVAPAKPASATKLAAPQLTPQQMEKIISQLNAQFKNLTADLADVKKIVASQNVDMKRLEALLIKVMKENALLKDDNAKLQDVLKILLNN